MKGRWRACWNMSKAAGAKARGCSMGGERVAPTAAATDIEPIIFECARPDLTIVREEIFGPVLAVTRFDGEDEVVAQANASAYGLGRACGRPTCRAPTASRAGCAGLVWVNCCFDGDVTVPFGGVKQSASGATSRCTRWTSTPR